MVILAEALYAVLTLDLSWWFSIIINNLPWLFVFFAAAYIFYDGKQTLRAMVFTVMYIWATTSFFPSLGIMYLIPSWFAFVYVSRVAGLTFALSVPRLKNRLPLIYVVLFYASIALVALGILT
ncbi:MAG: hypothetical protein Q7S92_00635 [Candidatus Diapherotrites archaeon]|nr:hypothetical protein [Candidatus Diapherotrites archaeon]